MMRFLIEATAPLAVFGAGAFTSLAVVEVSVQYALYTVVLLLLAIVATIVELSLDR